MSAEQMPILLDVDTGVDDALALGLALFWPADIITVSTLAGNVSANLTTTNTLAVLDLLGATEVPVCRGASRPLVKPSVFASHVHGETGLGRANLPASTRSEMREKGPASIVRNARDRKGELTLVCTGPLTNLAIALNVEPDLAKWIRKLVIMGGAYTIPGNITPNAEFNIYVDPDAANQVLASGIDDITLVGLDVTHQCVLTRNAWEAAQRLTSPTAVLVAEVCREAFDAKGREGVYLHDPLAVAIALDPALAEFEEVSVTVVTDGKERGRTETETGGPHKIARSVDVDGFLARVAETFGLPVEAMLHTVDNAL